MEVRGAQLLHSLEDVSHHPFVTAGKWIQIDPFNIADTPCIPDTPCVQPMAASEGLQKSDGKGITLVSPLPYYPTLPYTHGLQRDLQTGHPL